MISFKYTKQGKQVTPGQDDFILDYKNRLLITKQGQLPFMQLVHDVSAASETMGLSQKAGSLLNNSIIDISTAIDTLKKDVIDNEYVVAMAFKKTNEKLAEYDSIKQIIIDNEEVIASAFSNLDERTTHNETDIQALINKLSGYSNEEFGVIKTKVTALDTYINTDISTKLSELTASTAANDNQIKRLDSDVSVLNTSISGLISKTDKTTKDVTDLSTRLKTTEGTLTDISTDISTNIKPKFTQIDSSLSSLDRNISNATQIITQLDTSVCEWKTKLTTDIEDTEEVIATAFNVINSRIDGLESIREAVDNNKAELLQIIIDNEEVTATAITEYGERISQNESDINGLINKLSDFSANDYAAIKSNLSALDTYVKTNVSTGISTLKKDVSTLKTNTQQINSSLSVLDTSISNVDTKVAALDASLLDVSYRLNELHAGTTSEINKTKQLVSNLDTSVNNWKTELITDIEDTEEVIANAFKNINIRLENIESTSETDKSDIIKIITDNEYVTAKAITDLRAEIAELKALVNSLHTASTT